eukprot:462249-Rhodomonas_salina.2
MAGIPWELGGRHSSDGSDGLVDMLVYKDAEAPVARYCRLVDDKIFQMVPSDVSKPNPTHAKTLKFGQRSLALGSELRTDRLSRLAGFQTR